MNELWRASFELQKQALEAQAALLKAGGQTVDMGKAVLAAQEAARRAAEANMAAWKSWAKLWGVE